MVSEYCSVRVSRVDLSTKQATEPYWDNLLNRTRNPSEPYSDKEIPLGRALRRFAFLVGFSTGNPPKIGTFTAWNRTRNRTRTPSEESFLKLRRVTIQGAQPSARLSEEICLSKGSQGPLRGSLRGSAGHPRGSPGVCGICQG